jgi:predicted dehydrogenase
MVRVGLIGIGFMGWMHYLAYRRSTSAKLVAFASRDPKKREGDWRGIQGNFGPPSELVDVSAMNVYSGLDELLADPTIDVVDICLPPNLHADVAVAAMKAGKHVFCEKPIALRSADADRMIEAAVENDRLLLIAHVLPYIGPFAFAHSVVASGEFGRPLGGLFKRTISNPDWIDDFYNPETVGGPLIDLNVHDTHFIRMLFGMPISVTAVGRMAAPFQGKPPTAKFAQVCYEFSDPNVSVASTGGVLDGPARPFTHGFELQLEEAFLQFEFAALKDGVESMPLKIIKRSGEIVRPDLAAADDVTAFEAEVDDMAASIVSRRAFDRLDAQTARDAVYLAECIQRSVVERRTISS